jgi:tetratricopeptide (TPR) repeat protein
MISEDLKTTISQAASSALLRIGNTYHEQGLLHQALSPYLKILAYYPDSDEARAAVEGLLAIARVFEETQQHHMAISVYDRIERAVRFRRWDGHQVTQSGDIA